MGGRGGRPIDARKMTHRSIVFGQDSRSTLSTQLTHLNSTPFNSNQLISTHNSTQLISPYLTRFQLYSTDSTQLTHLNSFPFTSNQFISTHTTQLNLPHLISTQLNSLNTTHSSQLNSIQHKSAHLNSPNSTQTQLTLPHLISTQLN